MQSKKRRVRAVLAPLLSLLVLAGITRMPASEPPSRIVSLGTGIPGTSGSVTVTIARDVYGVPTIWSPDSDAGAYHGMGYACAQDRLGQMIFNRVLIRGRLAEFFEPPNAADPGYVATDPTVNKYLSKDIVLRTFGYFRTAQKVVDQMDSETLGLLQAYADGVNAYVADGNLEGGAWPPAGLAPGFDNDDLVTEGMVGGWAPVDMVSLWIRFGRLFTGTGVDEVQEREVYFCNGGTIPITPAELAEVYESLNPYEAFDEAAAVVQELDVPEPLRDAISNCAAGMGVTSETMGAEPLDTGQHFSQCWAVGSSILAEAGGVKSALFGHPQLPFGKPNHWWEANVKGASFEVRGAALAGTPNFVVGSTKYVSWAATVLGADQVDLFELTVDPNTNTYKYVDGSTTSWLPFFEEQDDIAVFGTSTLVPLTYKESDWGPVVTSQVAQPVDCDKVGIEPWPPILEGAPAEYANKDVLFHDPSKSPEAGFLATYRATNALEFRRAVGGGMYDPQDPESSRGGISFPNYNLIFADANGNVGYCPLGSMPLRSPNSPMGGGMVQDGSNAANDWIDIIPHDFKPWVINPAAGFVYSANHLPVGSWYPLPFVRTGGHTMRSRRVRERMDELAASAPVTAAQVRDVYLDTTFIKARDFARLGEHLRLNPLVKDSSGQTVAYQLEPDALKTLAALDDPTAGPWWGGTVQAKVGYEQAYHPAHALALNMGIKNFFNAKNLGEEKAQLFGKGSTGQMFWMRCKLDAIDGACPPASCPDPTECTTGVVFNLDEAEYLDRALCEAWHRTHYEFVYESQGWPPTEGCDLPFGEPPPEPPPSCGWPCSITTEDEWPGWFIDHHLHGDPAFPVRIDRWKDPIEPNLPGLEKGNPISVVGPFESVITNAILSPLSQSYSQFVPLGPGAGNAQSLCPIGQSERQGDPHYDDQLDLWVASSLKDSALLSPPWPQGSNPLTLSYP